MADPLWEEFDRKPGLSTATEDMSRVLVQPEERSDEQIMNMQIVAYERYIRKDPDIAAEYWRFVVRGWLNRGLSEEDTQELRKDVQRVVNRDNGIM